MTANNHTPIAIGAGANAATFNTPMGELDAAMGNLDVLSTKKKDSLVSAIREAASRRNLIYHSRGKVTWDPTTKIMSFAADAYVLYGTDAAATYFRVTGPFTIDFSSIPANSYGYAYVDGVQPGTTQSFSASAIKVSKWDGITNNVMDDGVIILAWFSNHTRIRPWSPFVNDDLSDAWFNGRFPSISKPNLMYHCRGSVSWNSVSKVLSFGGSVYVFYGLPGMPYARVVGPFTIDFSGIPASSYGYAYIKINDWETTYSANPTSVKVETWDGLTDRMLDPNVIVLAWFSNHTKVRVWTPFVADDISHGLLTGTISKAPVNVNLYPQLNSLLSGYMQKVLSPAADVRVVLWGDSIFSRESFTSASVDPLNSSPPLLGYKNISSLLAKAMPMNRATYRRFDYPGYFTEVGVWETSDNNANWDDAGDRPATTRLSAPATGGAASFAWTLGTSDDESGCNLIYRTDTAGEVSAAIAVAQGAGFLQYWTGTAWAEANGITLNMKETDLGDRQGNTIYQKRLRLRKNPANANATVTVTISRATADTDRLLYWGVELYDAKNGKFIPVVINSSRGGHTIDTGILKLYDYMDDDVTNQTPDLVIFELPLLNMITAAGATKAIILNSVQDMIWGDRSGFTNTWNLKTTSSTWTKFKVLIVLPHYSNAHFNTDNSFVEVFPDVTARDVYNAVKALILSKGEVGFVDMSAAMLREIDADPLWNGQYYAATAGSGAAGETYLNDGLHLNDKGTKVYVKHLAPLLDPSSS